MGVRTGGRRRPGTAPVQLLLRGRAMSSVMSQLPSAAATRAESILAEVLAGVLRVERVPVDSHFFEELDADSLVMAHFCARVRKRGDLPPVSMKDIYAHPTIRSLAEAPADVAPRSEEHTSELQSPCNLV